MSQDLFSPYQMHDLSLNNRIVMAPMTRNRANMDGTVTPMMTTHYQQRASAGLIIAEATPVSEQAIGYPYTPGIFTRAQMDSWKPLTAAVHAAGSKIFLQLQHCGRISHPSMQTDAALPVAPSALQPLGQAVTYQGFQKFVTPRALEAEEIPGIVQQFQHAAELAIQAGFDGIEIHAANGYLIDQFLRDGSNQRTDLYGGNIENRMRLLNEIIDASSKVMPESRIGVRLSPENSFNDMRDSQPQAHFEYITEQLSHRNLAYLHVLAGDMMTKTSNLDYTRIRGKFSGTYISNNGYTLQTAQTALQQQQADLIAFGIPFIANPDLVARLRNEWPLANPDQDTFYGGDERGYNDYPPFQEMIR